MDLSKEGAGQLLGGALGHEDGRLEPPRLRACGGHVVGIDVHRVPPDLVLREGHRIRLQDEVSIP